MIMETNYVPFETVEEFSIEFRERGGIMRKCSGIIYTSIAHAFINGDMYIFHPQDYCKFERVGSFNDLLEKYCFADGTPCGKEVKSCQI